jgi:hypothetical protein
LASEEIMSLPRSSTGDISSAAMNIGAMNTADRRAAVQREALERATAREERLASQRSPLNTPEDRIRIWERLHSLNLPSSITHKLVRVIATQTELTVQQVQAEQRRRAATRGGVHAPGTEEMPL